MEGFPNHDDIVEVSVKSQGHKSFVNGTDIGIPPFHITKRRAKMRAAYRAGRRGFTFSSLLTSYGLHKT